MKRDFLCIAVLLCALLLPACGATAVVGEPAADAAVSMEDVTALSEAAAPLPETSAAQTEAPALTADPERTGLAAFAALFGREQLEQLLLDGERDLNVENVPQNPELPNGCEITAATIALDHLGLPADKTTMAESYLRRHDPYTETDPELAYMGSPFEGEIGYYCMTGPVVDAVNAYLADEGEERYQAMDLSGADLRELKGYLNSGMPVLVWVTQWFEEPRRAIHFTLPNGEYPYVNLHCLVLTGYDGDTLYLADPLEQNTEVEAAVFEDIFEKMGRRAVVIAPR